VVPASRASEEHPSADREPRKSRIRTAYLIRENLNRPIEWLSSKIIMILTKAIQYAQSDREAKIDLSSA
jgi:hypothetical protein